MLPLNTIHVLFGFCTVSLNSPHIPTWMFKSSPCTFADFTVKTAIETLHLGCYRWKPHFPHVLHILVLWATFLICKENNRKLVFLRKKYDPVSLIILQLQFACCASYCTKGQRVPIVNWNHKTSSPPSPQTKLLLDEWIQRSPCMHCKSVSITKVLEDLNTVKETPRWVNMSFLDLRN